MSSRAAGRRVRLDALLVERGLAGTRARAAAMVLAGDVRVGGRVVTKAGAAVARDAAIEVAERPRWVSRAGAKLDGAIDLLGVDVAGRVCLDAGSSTGGFVEVLLVRGAARVHAVDVGRGLLDARLRSDARVVLHEGVNLRTMPPGEIGEAVDLATLDLAFISLRLVEPAVRAVVRPGGEVVALVKPQFEAGRGDVGRGGIVRDPEVRARAVERVVRHWEGAGWRLLGGCPSPLPGADGNLEHFVRWARP